MQSIESLTLQEVEQEVNRIVWAFSSRDRRISKDILNDLYFRFKRRDIAGLLIISLERLVSLDSEAYVWVVENILPRSLVREVRNLIMSTVCQNLIDNGYTPGVEFSVDGSGQLLLDPNVREKMFFT